jgi:hypothetical protein
MTLIVEDGTGVIGANSYVGYGYAHSYMNAKGVLTEWVAKTTPQKKAAMIGSTRYLDLRFGRSLKGFKLYNNLSIPGSALLSVIGLPVEDETLTIGETVYVFKTAATNPYEVTIGANIAATGAALVAIIAGGPNGTPANPDVSVASSDSLTGSFLLGVVALVAGALPEPIEVSTTSSNLSWDSSILVNDTDDGIQSLCFPRDLAYYRDGTQILGIPENLKFATMELAYRSLTTVLLPDPVVDDTGYVKTLAREKVGPVETEYRYSSGGISLIFKMFPEVELLMKEFIHENGGTYR